MKEEVKKEINITNKTKIGNPSCAVYGLGFIGALVYYIQNSQTFIQGVVGLLKAIVWPALLIYKILELLKI